MQGLSQESLTRLEQLANRDATGQPLLLSAGTLGKKPFQAILLKDTSFVPLRDTFSAFREIEFAQVERAVLTEDVGTRYVVQLTLSTDDDDVELVFDSRVVFLMFFVRLRSNEVECRFDFTSSRQKGKSGFDPVQQFRGIFAIAIAAALIAVLISYSQTKAGSDIAGGLCCVGIVVLFGAGGVFAYCDSYEPQTTKDAPLSLITAGEPQSEPIELDDRPLGLSLIGGETFADIRIESPRPAKSLDAARISDIERLLEE